MRPFLYTGRSHSDGHNPSLLRSKTDMEHNRARSARSKRYALQEIRSKFTPRGGISIDPYCTYGKKGTPWEKVAFERMARHDMYPEKVDNR